MSGRIVRRLLPALALAVGVIAFGGATVAAGSTAAECCTVTYNKQRTKVMVTGTVHYKGTPLLFSLDGLSPCASPGSRPGTASVRSRWVALRDLTAGYHTIWIVQRVNGRIVTTKSPRFYIKGTAQQRKPSVSITSGPSGVGPGTSALFEFTLKNTQEGRCRLDAAAWQQCKSWVQYKDLAPGPHVFRVRGIGFGGKQIAEAERTFVLSAPPPG